MEKSSNEKVIVVKQEQGSGIVKFFKRITNNIVLSLIIFLMICLIVFLLFKMYDYKNDSTIVTGIKFENMGELVTQEATVTVVKPYIDSREFLEKFDIPFTEYVYIFSYDVNVEAYIDFDKVSYEEKDNKFIVKLPHAKSKSPVIDDESKKVIYSNKNIFNSISLEENDDLRRKIKKDAAKQAEENGLRVKAEKNAETLISNMLKSDKQYKDYQVEFKYIGG